MDSGILCMATYAGLFSCSPAMLREQRLVCTGPSWASERLQSYFCYPHPNIHPCFLSTQVPPRNLKALALNLRLCSSDGGSGVGVDETAALLAVLELSADARADAGTLAVVGAAALLAVGVGDATARGKLPALAVSDVTGTSGVGDGLAVDGGSNYDGDVRSYLTALEHERRRHTGQDSEKSDADHFDGGNERRLVGKVE